MDSIMKASASTAEHYIWGDNCDGWHLLKSDSLSVIQERMPPGTAEQRHYHTKAQQLFFVLSGEAVFEIGEDGDTVRVLAHESLHVPPLTPHCIANPGPAELHFLVVSEPKAHGDRVTV
jgi:mannose-6-phosphate isomerase-like protein (cupin superfamily)